MPRLSLATAAWRRGARDWSLAGYTLLGAVLPLGWFALAAYTALTAPGRKVYKESVKDLIDAGLLKPDTS